MLLACCLWVLLSQRASLIALCAPPLALTSNPIALEILCRSWSRRSSGCRPGQQSLRRAIAAAPCGQRTGCHLQQLRCPLMLQQALLLAASAAGAHLPLQRHAAGCMPFPLPM